MILAVNSNILYIVSAGAALLIGFLVSIGYLIMQRNSQKSAYDAQLDEIISSGAPLPEPTITLSMRWNKYWGERLKAAGFGKYNEDDERAGRDVILISGAVFLASIFFFKNPLAGIVITPALIYGLGVFLKSKANRSAETLNAQLPGFLFAMKANVQANETPEKSILKVVDSMPSPLYDDLLIVKQRILANASFKDALEELSQKTVSRDLKFLCACMIQASTSGANLEEQITIIQGVLESRQKVTDELDKAVRSAAPAIWVASFVIPAVFLGTLMIDAGAKAFWFKDPLSWAALVAVFLFYTFGVFMSKKLVDGIRNL